MPEACVHAWVSLKDIIARTVTLLPAGAAVGKWLLGPGWVLVQKLLRTADQHPIPLIQKWV